MVGYGDIFRRSDMGEDSMNDTAYLSRCYGFFLGDPNTAAMFVDQGVLERCKGESGDPNWGRTRRPIKESCDLRDLQAALDANAVGTAEILAAIADVTKDSKALAAAYKIYSGVGGAPISPNAVTKPIFRAKWAQRVKSKTENCLSSIGLLDRLHTFACIAYLETDGLDIHPS